MVLAKSKNTVGLGNSLMHDRFGEGKGDDLRKGSAVVRRAGRNGESYVTNGPKEAGWVKMRSVTEQAALDEFLSTAELAGTDFTAEKLNNLKIIHPDQRNPYLLSAGEERSAVLKQDANRKRLTVPRRPAWNETMTKEELEAKERESFLDWRRDLAALQESDDLLMTPFERNIEVWRQLWRVIERSDLVVQIVDARNPLLFRSEDLEKYVKEVDPQKTNLLLVNKADMMTLEQRKIWASYFKEKAINFQFFSAALAKARNEAGQLGAEYLDEDALLGPEDDPTRILSVDELEELFLAHAPAPQDTDSDTPKQIQVGLVGYPNVGKSSTINALIGAKKVSVSATPGKTKHFQTIHLSPSVILCDCPGLVFPNFATTKAELVCNGILPIDQLREFTGPVGLVSQRIPKAFLEAMYGIKIHIRPLEEGGTGVPTAEELLVAYAVARGFTKTGQGQPDESRAARYILKDYVSGKLLFCHPPPSQPPINPFEFNRNLYSAAHLPAKRQGDLEAEEEITLKGAGHSMPSDESLSLLTPPVQGEKSSRIDRNFFDPTRGTAGHLTMPFNHKYSEQGSMLGKHLSGRKQRAMVALENGVDPLDPRMMNSKKHFKGRKHKGKASTEE